MGWVVMPGVTQTDAPESAEDPEEMEVSEMWACGRPIGPYRGVFPGGFIGRCQRRWAVKNRETLFPFGGTTESRRNWTVNDLRKGKPTGPDDEPLTADTGHDARDLPDDWTNEFEVVVADPPYGEDYSTDLYGVEYARPKSHMTEATRVVKPGGLVLILDQLVYNQEWAHDDHPVRREDVIGVTTGPNMRIRALNVFRVRSTFSDFEDGGEP